MEDFDIKMTPKTREVLISLHRQKALHEDHMRKALSSIGADVKKEIVRLIQTGPKTGRIYTINGRKHQASAPGESPANMTGRLAKGASYRTRNHLEMEVGISSRVGYANYLETGTKKMKPRPYLTRAVEANHRNAVLILQSMFLGVR